MNTHLRFSNQASFIWEVLLVFFSSKQINKVVEIVSSMYDQKFTFSYDLESFLVKLWEEPSVSVVYDIAKRALRQQLFSTEQHYYVVAMLLNNQIIDINEAMSLLDLNSVDQYEELDRKVKRVVDVLWLVKEDKKDSVMSPDDDDILKTALDDLKDMYKQIKGSDKGGGIKGSE